MVVSTTILSPQLRLKLIKTRGFLHLTYKLYHHLDKLGERKASCLCVYLGLLKYAWKKNKYTCHIRHATLEKDTQLSRPTIKRCLDTLEKMNVIKTIRGKSGKTYVVNDKFLKEEKAMIVNNELSSVNNELSNVNKRAILEETTYQYNTIDKIISINRGNLDNTINELATLPLPDLIKDTNNVYYCKLAIQRKEELARQKNLVDPQIIQRELKKISKETNVRYKEKRDYNIRNNIKPWEK
jgi:DNA-binding MarR family transcriptional regulator